MIIRVLSSVNWAVGILALGGAVIVPLYHESRIAAVKSEVEAVVENIAQAERIHMETRYQYLYDRANLVATLRTALRDMGSGSSVDLNRTVEGFRFEAVSDPANVLVIRAFPTDAALKDGKLQPMLYRYEVADPNDLAQPRQGGAVKVGTWSRLSGKKSGLLGLVGL